MFALLIRVGLFCLSLTACVPLDLVSEKPRSLPNAPLPGGSTYSWGWSQRPESREEIDKAQSGTYSDPTRGRRWSDIPVSKATETTMGNLSHYFPLHARWRLKDGREFIVDRLDVAQIVREYFQTNKVLTQWQREGRARAKVGDGDPVLAHEVRGDELILKWVIKFNRTPVDMRLANVPWRFEEEHFVIRAVKGRPTSGIDFAKAYDH